jgi:hypothetical protein
MLKKTTTNYKNLNMKKDDLIHSLWNKRLAS